VGVLLAGGRGRRLGAPKATAELAGRPLLAWAWEAMRATVDELAVVAKSDTPLPELPDTLVWREPAEPRHPLAGVVHALARADGRAVLVCPADLPLMTAAVLGAVVSAGAGGAPAAVARTHARVQPLVGVFSAGARERLESIDPGVSVTAAVLALEPVLVEIAGERPFLNVNTPEDLAQAARLLGGR
jgi:molybdopterin-guanine dinucleotide biosynthesis protein A